MADGQKTTGAMTAEQLMNLFGIEKTAFYELGRKGIAEKVGRGLYNGPRTIRNYIVHLRNMASGRQNEDGIDVVEQGARLKKAQADKTEYQLAILKGEYILATDIAPALETIARATQSALLGTTATAAKDLGLDRSQTSRLDEIIREALENLANEGARIEAKARSKASGQPTPPAQPELELDEPEATPQATLFDTED
jgi:phage terminase Nu1 subunit (DNA packaging protein)